MLHDPLAGFAPRPPLREEPAQLHPVDPTSLGVGKVLYSLREAKTAFGYSRSYIYALIAAGELRSFKSGKTRRILGVDFARHIAARLESPSSKEARHAGA
jgi:excisionase family DNA binding protein